MAITRRKSSHSLPSQTPPETWPQLRRMSGSWRPGSWFDCKKYRTSSWDIPGSQKPYRDRVGIWRLRASFTATQNVSTQGSHSFEWSEWIVFHGHSMTSLTCVVLACQKVKWGRLGMPWLTLWVLARAVKGAGGVAANCHTHEYLVPIIAYRAMLLYFVEYWLLSVDLTVTGIREPREQVSRLIMHTYFNDRIHSNSIHGWT